MYFYFIVVRFSVETMFSIILQNKVFKHYFHNIAENSPPVGYRPNRTRKSP